MNSARILPIASLLLALPAAPVARAQQTVSPALPEIRQLMKEVQEHQKQLEKVRENYTYSDAVTTQEIDGNGQVKKTETEEWEEFFVNGHQIGRKVKKDGKPLDGHDLDKETERVTKEVEKAEKTPPDQADGGPGDLDRAAAGDHGCAQSKAGDLSRPADDRLRFCGPQGRQDARPDRGRLKETAGNDVGG